MALVVGYQETTLCNTVRMVKMGKHREMVGRTSMIERQETPGQRGEEGDRTVVKNLRENLSQKDSSLGVRSFSVCFWFKGQLQEIYTSNNKL